MPDISISHGIVAGSAIDADALSDALFRRESTPNTLDVVNGGLTDANLATPIQVPREVMRPESFTSGRMVGATASLDYFKDPWFLEADLTDISDETGYPILFRGVPGASQSFHTRRTARALLVTWSLTGICDTDQTPSTVQGVQDGTAGWRLALYLNGLRISETDMRLPPGRATMRESDDPTQPYTNVTDDSPDIREYSGFMVIDGDWLSAMSQSLPAGYNSPLLTGWHTASIRVVTNQDQVRLYTRRMSVLPLYWT